MLLNHKNDYKDTINLLKNIEPRNLISQQTLFPGKKFINIILQLNSNEQNTNKVYETLAIFTVHIKSKTHKKWIDGLNANKVNLYMENVQLKQVLGELRLILSRYEIEMAKLKRNFDIELSNKQQTIDSLTNCLSEINEKQNSMDCQDL